MHRHLNVGRTFFQGLFSSKVLINYLSEHNKQRTAFYSGDGLSSFIHLYLSWECLEKCICPFYYRIYPRFNALFLLLGYFAFLLFCLTFKEDDDSILLYTVIVPSDTHLNIMFIDLLCFISICMRRTTFTICLLYYSVLLSIFYITPPSSEKKPLWPCQ